MILDRTWNKHEKKLTISYVDERGNRQFWHRYLSHIKTYEYDKDGACLTWNGKKCSKVYKDTSAYNPNEFDILELMFDMEKYEPAMLENFHAQRFPKIYTWDIETEVSNEFPYPDKALQMITSISVVAPDLSCIVLGLHDLDQEAKDRMRERYLKWVEDNAFAKSIRGGKDIRVLYQHFDNEEAMIRHFFERMLPKIGFLAGWNVYSFDWQYITNRLKRIIGDEAAKTLIKNASPTKTLDHVTYVDMSGHKTKIPSPQHCAILDYMELVKKYDYILRPYESYSLDWVAEHAVNAHKIKYSGTLQQLYEKDFEWYYFYNAIDSLLVMLIHYRLKSLESPAALSAVSLVPLLKSLEQVTLTTANIYYDFYLDDKHIVWDRTSLPEKQEYEGAIVACVPGHYKFNVCDDFASLYPSQIQTCNLSFENIMYKEGDGKWTEEELAKYREDPNYFVSVMGNVYKNDKDYCFKKMQRRFKKRRDFYKYTGQKIDSELLVEIDKLLCG